MKTLAALCAFGALLLAPLQAVTLLEDNFESYSLGSTPTAPGDGNPNLWAFSANIAGTVVAGSSPGGSGANQQVLSVTNNTPDAYATFHRSFERQTADGENDIIRLELSLKRTVTDASDYMIDVIDTVASTITGPVIVRISGAGVVEIQSGNGAPGNGLLRTYLPTLGTLNTTDWYRFTITLDLSSQTFSVSVTNISTYSQSATSPALYFYTDVQAVDRFFVRSTATTANAELGWLIDDVLVQAIPEPALAPFLGVAGVLLATSRRRPRKRG